MSAMPAAAWVTLLVTFAAAVVVPGPDTFLVLKLGVRSRTAALWGAAGIMTGNAVWTTASVAGLAAIVVALPGLLPILQLVGAAVLGWMGVQGGRSAIRALRERRDRTEVRDVASADQSQVSESATGWSARRPMWQGFVTNMSNPKALLFFTALFSQILPAEATLFDRTLVVVALTVVGLAWFVAFALLTSSRAFQRWFGRATPVIDLCASVVFLLVAVVVVLELVFALL
ncbi:LysE family translocator [Leucobacter sp. 1207-22]